MTTPTRVPVIVMGRVPDYYLGVAMTCINCACVTELNPDNGSLAEFPRWRLVNLMDPDNNLELPRQWQTLGFSRLYNGMES